MENNVKEYLAFQHGQVRMPEHLAIRKGVTGRLFKNKFMELLTRTNILVPIIVHLSTSSFIFWYGLTKLNIEIPIAIALVLAGILFWSFAEYSVHRFFYHTETNSKFFLSLSYAAARAGRSRSLAVIANQYADREERERLYGEAVEEATQA
ncbi:MAG: hypothetical protein ABJG78_15800, partial [Cyclobacteriaceae bacterium]